MAQILSLPPPNPSYRNQTPQQQHSSTRRRLTASTSSTHSWTSVSHSVKCNGRVSCLFSDNRKQLLDNGAHIWLRKPLYGVSRLHHSMPYEFSGASSSIGFGFHDKYIMGIYYYIYNIRKPMGLFVPGSRDSELILMNDQARKALEGALGEKKTEFEKWNQEIKKREEAGSGGGNSGGGGGWFGWRGWFGGSDGDRFWQEAQQASLTILGIFVVYLIVAKGDVMLAVIFNPLLFALRGTRNSVTYLTSKITNRAYNNRGDFGTPQEEVPVPVSAKEKVVGKWGSS